MAKSEQRERAPSEFVREDKNAFEPWFNDVVSKPLAKFIPRWVHPNFITFISAVDIVVFTILAAAVTVVNERPLAALFLRSLVGFAIFVYAVLDCLDGVHARNTKQCSKTGEALDHWVDAFGIPLTPGTLVLTLHTDNFVMCMGMAGAALTFSTQLAMYHETGKFVAQDNSGVLGQLAGALVCPVTGILTYTLGRSHWACVVAINIVGLGAIFGFFDNARAFCVKLGLRKSLSTQGCTALCCFSLFWLFGRHYMNAFPESEATAWGGWFPNTFWEGNVQTLIGTGKDDWFTSAAFICMQTCISLRVSGTYVLATRTGKSFSGFDNLAFGWTAAMFVAHFLRDPIADAVGPALLVALPFIALFHMALVSLLDLRTAFNILLDE